MTLRLFKYVICVLTLIGIDFNYDVHINGSLFALISLCTPMKCH